MRLPYARRFARRPSDPLSYLLVLGIWTLALLCPLRAEGGPDLARPAEVRIGADRTLLRFQVAPPAPGGDPIQAGTLRLVAVPPDARTARLRVRTGHAPAAAPVETRVLSLRGTRVVAIPVLAADAALGPLDVDVEVEVFHDGDWTAPPPAPTRCSRGFAALLGEHLLGLPPGPGAEGDGAFVIVTTAELAGAVQPLADWKRRKGFPTVVVTTEEVGGTQAAIVAWLRDAYRTWETPPEYVLLFGDVEDVPAGSFLGTVSDHGYALMDGDDWLPDLMVGRLPADGVATGETIVAKTLGYERTPSLAGPDWFARSLMVGGDYAAASCVSTIRWCGRHLETIGFARADTTFYPPWWNGVTRIRSSIDAGVSVVAYRGWAYGTGGWEPPHFTSEDIATLSNGPMTPIVLSFTCQTGDFSAPACFGEVWLRTGTAVSPRGAVAFVGNGEHWSHTRYNDAMAISFFERIVDPEVRSLGGMMTAGKLRFLEYFPHEMENGTEESVEFYFHVYTLLGDPELSLWKTRPSPIVAVPAAIPSGANTVDVRVFEEDGATPLAGARVGLLRGSEERLGSAITDDAGLAHLVVPNLLAGDAVAVTVTAADRVPHESVAVVGSGASVLAVSDFALAEAAGNGDGIANPGETLDILVTLLNGGGQTATGVSSVLACEEGATVVDSAAAFPDIPAGGSAPADDPFRVVLDPDLADGARVAFRALSRRDGGGPDPSDLVLDVAAPVLTVRDVVLGGDGHAYPGGRVALIVELANAGHAAAGGLTGTIRFADTGQGVVTDETGRWGAIAVGDSAANAADPFEVRIDDDVPPGARIAMLLDLASVEGYERTAGLEIVIGSPGPGLPVGPDAYGYYAFDSADTEFPSECPAYAWTEISPAHGGAGTLRIAATDRAGSVLVDLPFPFVYYGETTGSTIRVYRNGYVSFEGQEYFDFYNWPIPSEFGAHSIVAPFWDNLSYTQPDPLQDGVYTMHDPAEGRFIVEWSRLRNLIEDLHAYQTFQLVLLDPARHATRTGDGEILFFYNQIENNDIERNYATVGIENREETGGLQISYADGYALGAAALSPGLAVKLTTDLPVYDPSGVLQPALTSRFPGLWIHPNPSAGEPRITLLLPETTEASLGIFDAGGRRLRALLPAGRCDRGLQVVIWDGRDGRGRTVPPGVYFCKLDAGGATITRKILRVP